LSIYIGGLGIVALQLEHSDSGRYSVALEELGAQIVPMTSTPLRWARFNGAASYWTRKSAVAVQTLNC
jgi:hypothetical protein